MSQRTGESDIRDEHCLFTVAFRCFAGKMLLLLLLRGLTLGPIPRFLSDPLCPLEIFLDMVQFYSRRMFLFMCALAVCGIGNLAFAQTRVATLTTIAVTSGASPVTSIASGSVITLTASVSAGSTILTIGQVNFCDAPAARCTDIHLLGTAQLTNAGTAVLKLRPGVGNRNFTAVFPGTNHYAPSVSGTSALSVTGTTGTYASATAMAEIGGWGSYTLTATVTEMGGTASPTGNASFLDTSNGNSVLATIPLGASTASVGWPSPEALTTDRPSQGEAVGDFNGDGIPDVVAVASGPTQPLLVWLGNANGTYTAAPSPEVSGYTFAPILVADFNGDGKQDLAVLDGDNNTVSILLGHGDGTFTVVATSATTGSSPGQFAVGDFNDDGIPDLVVTSRSSTPLTILLGKGDGTFTAASASPTANSSSPYFIATGDFNGDGKLDFAVTDLYDDTVSILLGHGDGTFAAVSAIHSGSNGSPVAAADFNEDGKLDLAVGVAGASGVGDSVTILTGKGDGTFSSPQSTQAVESNSVSLIQAADFNGDGIADLVLTDSASGVVTVFLGTQGGGTFSQASFNMVTAPYYESAASVADMDGDGRADLLLGNQDGNDQVLIYLTRPAQTTSATASIALPVTGVHQVTASYSGDSHYLSSTSGTTTLSGQPPATTTTLSLTAGGVPKSTVASGTVIALTAAVKVGGIPITAGQVNFCDASATYCTDVHVLGTAQLTNSGTATFKFVPGAGQHHYKAVFLQEGAGTGSVSNVETLTVGPAPTPVYTDTTLLTWSGSVGDYSLTATVIGAGGPTAPTGSVSFLDTSDANTQLAKANLGASTPGIGWRISQTPATTQSPIGEVTADLNGDGIPDLALLWNNGDNVTGQIFVTILLGKGDGTFATGGTTQATGVKSEPNMISGDFNGDGKPDLAILSSDGYSSSFITAMLGNGDGTFAAPQTGTVYDQGAVGGDFIRGTMVTADFNGDGKMDLAVVGDYVSTGGVTVLLGNGDGTFSAMGSNLAISQGYGLIATGDFNGDHIPDLVATQYFGPGGATVFLGKGDGSFATGTSLTIGPFPSSIIVGDFNADGVLDLAIGSSGAVTVLLGKGDGTFDQGPGGPLTGAGQSLVAGDFNQDGKLDLAGIDNYNDQIDLFTGAGDGTFTESVTTPNVSQAFIGPFAIVPADFNGDGAPDLAMLTTGVNTASILLSKPTQTATAAVTGIAPIGTETHNVEARYSGDSTYASSVSGTVTLYPGTAPVTYSPAAGALPAPQTITLSESIPGATIYYSASGIVNTYGFVHYTGPISLPIAGNEEIQAYATETGYSLGNTTTADFTLTPAGIEAANVSLTPSAPTITDQQPVSIAVTVSGASGQAVPTGSVSLAVAAFNAQENLKNGATTLNIPPGTLSAGANHVNVTYSGDTTFAIAKGSTTITVARVVISQPTPVSVSPGGSATAKLVLSGDSTYSGTMRLACALTTSPAAAQDLPTCSLNPTSVAMTPNGTASTVFTVQTTGSSQAGIVDSFGWRLRWVGGGSTAFAVVILLGVPNRRRRWAWMVALVIGAGAAGTIGCGGGKQASSVQSTAESTPGNYVFTVTGIDAANAEITTVTTVNVTVQ